MNAPREVKIAVLLAWIVLVIQTVERIGRIFLDTEASSNLRYRLISTALTLSGTALVAYFVFFTSRRRNWGRIGLLAVNLWAWCLLIFYWQNLEDYLWWQWLAYGALTAMELVALLLLFSGNGSQWFRSAPKR